MAGGFNELASGVGGMAHDIGVLVGEGGVFGSDVAEMAGGIGGLEGCSFLGDDGMSKLQSIHTAGHKDISSARYYTSFFAVNAPSSLISGIQ